MEGKKEGSPQKGTREYLLAEADFQLGLAPIEDRDFDRARAALKEDHFDEAIHVFEKAIAKTEDIIQRKIELERHQIEQYRRIIEELQKAKAISK